MRFLCIDTSTGMSVAVVNNEGGPLSVEAHLSTDAGNTHAEQLTPLIEACIHLAGHSSIAEAEIDAVLVGRGPATFTGLRAGLVSAQTIADALGVDIYGIESLSIGAYESFFDPIARSGRKPAHTDKQGRLHRRVMVATDAKRRELYCGVYCFEDGGIETVMEPAVVEPADVPSLLERFHATLAVGPGTELYREAFDVPGLTVGQVDMQAATLAQIFCATADTAQFSDVSPLYLRRPDVHVKAAQ